MTTASADLCIGHFFSFCEFTDEEKEKLVSQYRFTTLQQLISKVDDLKNAKLRGGIKRTKQLQLWKCVLWIQDYRRIHKKYPLKVHEELTEDTLVDFEGHGYRIPFPQGASLRHVFAVLLANNNSLQITLADLGICTFDDAIQNRKELEGGSFGQNSELGSIPSRVQKQLAQVVDWFDDFSERIGRKPDIQQELDQKEFDGFLQRNRFRYVLCTEEYFTLTKIAIHQGGLPTFLSAYPKEQRPPVCEQVITHAIKEVKDKFITQQLAGTAPDIFDKLISHWVRSLINFEQEDTFMQPLVVQGDTQMGKSKIKGVILAICQAMGVPAIVVSKGVPESAELVGKLRASSPDPELVVGKNALRKNNENEVRRVLEKGGAVVVADTKAQLEKVNHVLSEYSKDNNDRKFVLLVDEADAMYRTYDKSQKFEAEFEKLMAKRPCIRFMITATPVPALLALAEEEGVGDRIICWKTKPCDDYVGIDQMKPLKDEDGKDMFLGSGELKHSTGVYVGGSRIPYTCEKVMRLYLDAAQPGKKNVLLLDITSPRVHVDGNVKVKAKLVQRYLKQKQDVDITVVIRVAGGIFQRLPGGEQELCDKGLTICEVLDSIRENFQGPIFVFGFALMKRGISYRSTTDVPNYIVLNMGGGHTIENYVQSVGRATFVGKNLLEENGHSHVTALMPTADWNMVKAWQKYILEFDRRVSLGERVLDAMSGAKEALPEYADYLQFTTRRTGVRSKHKPGAFDLVHRPRFHASTQLAKSDEDRVEWYAENANQDCHRVLKVCKDLWEKTSLEFYIDDIVEAFNDTYRKREDVKSMSKTRALTHIKQILKDRLLTQKLGEKCKRYSLDRVVNRCNTFLLKVSDLRRSRIPIKMEDFDLETDEHSFATNACV